MSMGRAARKDAVEDASWRRLPQRVFWRFYPAFEGLLGGRRVAGFFPRGRSPRARRDERRSSLAGRPAPSRSGPSEAGSFPTISGPSHGSAGPFSRNPGPSAPSVSPNAGPNRAMISGRGADDLRPLQVAGILAVV